MGSFRSRVFSFALLFSVPSLRGADSALLFNKIFGGTGNDYVTAIATDPSGYVIVAGTTSSYDFPVTDGTRNTATHFAVTADSGASWQPLANLPSGTPVSLAVAPGTPPVWYAAGNSGIFKSTDGGATWSPSLPLPGPLCNSIIPSCGANALAVDPAQPSTVYAIVKGQIVKTTDAGATWTSGAKPPAGPNSVSYLVLDPFHRGHILTGNFVSQFRSFDGGLSWTQYTTPAPTPNNFCTSTAAPVAFDQATPDVAYITDHCSLFRSTDGGLSWSVVSAPITNAFSVIAPAKSAMIFSGAYGGLFASADHGVTWTLLLPTADGAAPRFVAVDPAQPLTIIAGGMRSLDGGATWMPFGFGREASAIVFDPARRGRALAATAGASTGFLAKLDSAGTILAATLLGGQGGTAITGVTAGAGGRIYATGSTLSPDFPVTPGASLTTPPAAGNNYFVTAFDPDLNPIYSTYLPAGIGQASGIAVDPNGGAAVTGYTTSVAGSAPKCFAAKLKPDGSGSVFFTRFGGTNSDICSAIAADNAGNTVIAGTSWSSDFPVAGNGAQTKRQGFNDAIVAKLDPDGNLVYSAYLGGADRDTASAVAVDAAGNIYVTGNTASKDFPTTPGAWQISLGSNCPYPSSTAETGFIGTIVSNYTDDAFVTKLDPAGNLLYSTFLGGGCYDLPRALAVDPQGNAWITGTTDSDPFPQVMPFESGPPYAYYKAFVSELDPSGSSLKLSSYISAGNQPVVAVDTFGDAYVGGVTIAPQSPFGGPPAPPPVVTGVHASVGKVQPQFPGPVAIGSVGNAFTLRSGPVSPGQITLVSAVAVAPANPQDLTFTPADPLPRILAGTQVLFDGEPALLISVDAGRVVAVAPYDLAGKKQTAIQVVFQGAMSAPVMADVLPDPGYLSADGTGTGQAYARNPDGTLNSVDNPAPRGSLLTVYVTGTAATSCPEAGVGPDGYVCGIFQTTIQTPTYGLVSKMQLPNSALTYAVQ